MMLFLHLQLLQEFVAPPSGGANTDHSPPPSAPQYFYQLSNKVLWKPLQSSPLSPLDPPQQKFSGAATDKKRY